MHQNNLNSFPHNPSSRAASAMALALDAPLPALLARASTRAGARACAVHIATTSTVATQVLLDSITELWSIEDDILIMRAPRLSGGQLSVPGKVLEGVQAPSSTMTHAHACRQLRKHLLGQLLVLVQKCQRPEHPWVSATLCRTRLATDAVWEDVYRTYFRASTEMHPWLFDVSRMQYASAFDLVQRAYTLLVTHYSWHEIDAMLTAWQGKVHRLQTHEQVHEFTTLVHGINFYSASDIVAGWGDDPPPLLDSLGVVPHLRESGAADPFPSLPGKPVKLRKAPGATEHFTTGVHPADIVRVGQFVRTCNELVAIEMGDVCLIFMRRDLLLVACALYMCEYVGGRTSNLVVLRPFIKEA